MATTLTEEQQSRLRRQLELWAGELGFAQLGISDIHLQQHEAYLQKWLQAGYHGSMDYMERHGEKRARPAQLIPDTCRVITLRMDYLAADTRPEAVLENPAKAYISRYALGRDYHKLVRKRLAQLAARLQQAAGGGQYRAFVDSAPVLERALAERAGMGWIAKNPPRETKHCGSCTACLTVCPTDAFVGPFQLDARRCISYLTIEHKGSIDEALRPLMGNRIFGCDDCQLVCPWNKFARHSDEPDFQPRHDLQDSDLVELFLWDEATFLARTEGSAIRRIGHERWLRNIAVALGNAPPAAAVVAALGQRLQHPSALVREHVAWALQRQRDRGAHQ
mgnify:FL=1